MNPPADTARLREMLLNAPESTTTATLAIVLSVALLVVVLVLVRRGRLREEFTPIWMAVAVGMTLVSLRLSDVEWTRPLGVIHKRNRKLSNAASRFVELLHEAPDSVPEAERATAG